MCFSSIFISNSFSSLTLVWNGKAFGFKWYNTGGTFLCFFWGGDGINYTSIGDMYVCLSDKYAHVSIHPSVLLCDTLNIMWQCLLIIEHIEKIFSCSVCDGIKSAINDLNCDTARNDRFILNYYIYFFIRIPIDGFLKW